MFKILKTKKYVYHGVTFRDFTRFEIADSQGIALNKTIKKKYGFDNLGKIDTKFITEEIKSIKDADLNDLGERIINQMNMLIKENNENDTYPKNLLYNLKNSISNYENKRDSK